MHTLLFISAAFSAVLAVFAAPTVNLTITKHTELERGSYIVKLKDCVSKDTHIANLLSSTSHSKITHKYKDDSPFYAVELTDNDLDFVRRSSDVESIREDGILNVESENSGASREANPGVQLANHSSKRVDFPGIGADVYIVNTGIYVSHSSLWGSMRGENRVVWGWAFDRRKEDQDGHGTHVAGLIGGRKYGLASGAHLIAVKVSSHGPGHPENIRRGIQWVIDQVVEGRKRDPPVDRPTIIHLSFPIEPGYVNSLNEVMQTAHTEGIHMVIGAGDRASEMNNVEPVGPLQAIVVSAVDKHNQIAAFANYGELVDVWAPGVDMESAWVKGQDAVHRLSGTAQAAARVTGLLAKMLSNQGNTSPADLIRTLHHKAVEVPQLMRPELGEAIRVATEW